MPEQSSTAGHRRAVPGPRALWCAATLITFAICFQISSSSRRVRPDASYTRLYGRSRGSVPFAECNQIRSAKDQCAWVHDQCSEEEAGLFSYLGLYYCSLSSARPLALLLIISWLSLLFSTIGIAASDFFSVNLSTIANLLGLSEDLAGVTFLALGNGSPDVFSTFAAMNTHSGSMAIGELIGAAGFITAVVVGSMALIRPFEVPKAGFIRDVSFFIAASVLTMALLADGQLLLWECILMVSFYLVYVVVVVTWHWLLGRKNARLVREARSRGHFLLPDEVNTGADALAAGPLNDFWPGSVPPSGDAQPDPFAALAANARHTREASPGLTVHQDSGIGDDHHLNVGRSRRHSRRLTGSAIRPSLVGALEFRSLLSSLEKSRHQDSTPTTHRRHSHNPTSKFLGRPEARSHDSPHAGPSITAGIPIEEDASSSTGRGRATSMNDAAMFPNDPIGANYANSPGARSDLSIHTDQSSLQPPTEQSATTPTMSSSYFLPATGAFESSLPEGTNPQILRTDTETSDLLHPGMNRRVSSGFLLNSGTAASSPSAPFPSYHDDLDSHPSASRQGSFKLPPPRLDLNISAEDDVPLRYSSSPVRWWPYALLPEPSVFFSTLFPTLYRWQEKTAWERLLGVVSAPSVFLLTITLPVVEYQLEDDTEISETDVESALPTLSVTRVEDSGVQLEPPLISVSDPSEDTPLLHHEGEVRAQSAPEALSPVLPMSPMALSSAVSLSEVLSPFNGEDTTPLKKVGWNRWLVCVQVFMGPFFVMLIVWANTDESGSLKQLIIMEAFAVITSLIMLALILLFTEVDRSPQYRPLLCFVGFIVSVAWISTIANEVVGVLKALGIILGMSEAILGLTVFAVGNSLGDLVADITIARLGYPVMAFSACIGGPMLNILLGIGLGGIYMTIKEADEAGVPASHQSFEIKVGTTLLISCIALLVTLIGLLVVVPLNGWKIDRRIGIGLLSLWVVATSVNLLLEVTSS